MWRATVLTLFPELFPGPLEASLIGKALNEQLWSLEIRDIRAHGLGRHRNVDDTPSGGGPGMVMRPDVAVAGIDAALADDAAPRPLIYLSPRGKPLDQSRVRELASGSGVILFCGRFEGLDQRAIEGRNMEEISLGDFVLAGGEIAAMALLESCVRLIPGVMGSAASRDEESFEQYLLEYPHYTRPQVFEGVEIPAVLNSGNHEEIARWRKEQAEGVTRAKRPDLWTLYEKLSRSARTPGSQKKSRRTGGNHEPDPDA